jgi:REP element-mobilizing transposase RayT
MGRTRYRFGEAAYPYFVTCSIVGWQAVFTRPDLVEIVLDSWRFLHERGRMLLLGYVILENHLQFIATSERLSQEVGDFKSYTARRIIDRLKETGSSSVLERLQRFKLQHKTDREYQLWQEGSHPQMIVDEAMMWQKLEYIHNNPVRRGYVDDPAHWRYSSARNYSKLAALVPVIVDWMYARALVWRAARGNAAAPIRGFWRYLAWMVCIAAVDA